MGWDNESKIAILDEHIKTFNSQDGLQDHIIKLQTKKVGIILEIKVFLALELYWIHWKVGDPIYYLLILHASGIYLKKCMWH